ncbi:uncharacterized protein LOC144427260 [Styela clava]
MENKKSTREDISKADPSQKNRLDGEIHDENKKQGKQTESDPSQKNRLDGEIHDENKEQGKQTDSGLINSYSKHLLVTVLKVSLILAGIGLIFGLVIRESNFT